MIKYYRVYDLKNKVVVRKATAENKYKDGYYEVPYIEYYEDGTVHEIGTEDFSSERLKTIKTYEIVAKTDEKTKKSSIYKGGRTRWEHVRFMYVTERKTAKKVAEFLYKDKEINVR